MKTVIRGIAAVGFVGLLCAVMPKPASAFVSEQDWQYVQAVGGMKLGTPQQKEGNWTLPVDIDVTGSRAITTKPTAEHPGLVCAGIQAEPHGNTFYFSLFTSYPWLGADKGGGCPAIILGHLTPGTYSLYYRGLGEEAVKLEDIIIP